MINYERECDSNHIKIIEKDIGFKGAFINYKSLNVIVIKPHMTNSEINCVACEELGHFYTRSTYNINCTDSTFISKQEHKAKKYAYERLVPYDVLRDLSHRYDLYEICDKLDVTEEFLRDAIQYYVGKFGK